MKSTPYEYLFIKKEKKIEIDQEIDSNIDDMHENYRSNDIHDSDDKIYLTKNENDSLVVQAIPQFQPEKRRKSTDIMNA